MTQSTDQQQKGFNRKVLTSTWLEMLWHDLKWLISIRYSKNFLYWKVCLLNLIQINIKGAHTFPSKCTTSSLHLIIAFNKKSFKPERLQVTNSHQIYWIYWTSVILNGNGCSSSGQCWWMSSRVGPIDDAIVHRRWLTDITMLSRHRDSCVWISCDFSLWCWHDKSVLLINLIRSNYI